MARNNGNGKGYSKDQADWKNITFVDIPLSEADKTHFKSLDAKEADELLDSLVTLVQSEYKFSVTWDQRNSCFIASATGKHEADDNFNLCLSARSRDCWEAVRLLMFKHMYLAKDGTWPKERPSSDWG